MTIKLPVTKRDDAIKTEALRVNGLIPAVIYGPKQAPTTVVVDEKIFDKIRQEAGESTVLELTGLAKPIEVLIKDVDFNPVKQRVMHVDFYAVEQGKEINTHVALHFVGEAPVEQTKLGLITKVLHEVEVTCMPAVLPAHIDVDLNILSTLEDRITIKDLVVAEGVKIEAEPNDVVVIVSPVKEEEADDISETVDMSVIEVEQKGKTEAE